MKFTSVLASALLVGAAAAVDVACLVNGESVAVVDSDTGVCPFTIPDEYPVNFEFTSMEDYDTTFYYAEAAGTKYTNDIVNAGRAVAIPAATLFGAAAVVAHQVSLVATPPSNSTAAMRKRFLKGSQQLATRDEIDEFLAMALEAEGTPLPGLEFAVVLASEVSSSAEGVATETNTETTIVTITSCSDNKCGETTVPATPSDVTTTVEGIETISTTYCPVTTVVTITSCSEDKCSETEVPVSPSLTTETVEGEVTSYYTYCPITEEGEEEGTMTTVETSYLTITSCSEGKCATTDVPATEGETTSVNEAGETTTYTTWCPVTTTEAAETEAAETEAPETKAEQTEAEVPTTEAPSTVADVSTTLATSGAPASSGSPISTYEGAGNKAVTSLMAMVLVPLAGLML